MTVDERTGETLPSDEVIMKLSQMIAAFMARLDVTEIKLLYPELDASIGMRVEFMEEEDYVMIVKTPLSGEELADARGEATH